MIEAALAVPASGFGDREFYPTLHEKAAALLYSLVKGHPCPTGNKRLAAVLTIAFLELNGQFLWVGPRLLEEEVLAIAASDPKDAPAVRAAAATWLRDHVIPSLRAAVQINAGILP